MAISTAINDTGPIRPENIYSVLGVAPRANGYDLGYICVNAHGKTNKWARFKPEKTGGPSPISNAERKANNYGLKPSISAAFNGLAESAQNAKMLSEITYNYAPPSASDWQRITDWAGYEHLAAAPHTTPNDVIVPFGVSEFDIMLPLQKTISKGGLNIEDFNWAFSIANTPKYFTVIVFWKKSDDSSWYIAGRMSAPRPISLKIGGGTTYVVTMTTSDITSLIRPSGYNPQLYFFCCLCDHQYTDFNTSYSAKLYPLLSDTPPVGKLTVQKNASAALTITHVGPKNKYNTTDAGVYPISNFSLATIDEIRCWGARSPTNMWLHGQFKNTTGIATTLQRTRILFKYTDTLATEEVEQRATPASAMYIKSSGTWTSTNSVTVSSGATVDVVFDVSDIPYLNSKGYISQAVRDHVFMVLGIYQGTSLASTDAILGRASLYVADSTSIKIISKGESTIADI